MPSEACEGDGGGWRDRLRSEWWLSEISNEHGCKRALVEGMDWVEVGAKMCAAEEEAKSSGIEGARRGRLAGGRILYL